MLSQNWGITVHLCEVLDPLPTRDPCVKYPAIKVAFVGNGIYNHKATKHQRIRFRLWKYREQTYPHHCYFYAVNVWPSFPRRFGPWVSHHSFSNGQALTGDQRLEVDL
jgi:hypothetical protein